MPSADPRLLRRLSGEVSSDGRHVLFHLEMADGTRREMIVPADALPNLAQYLKQQAGIAVEMQRQLSPADPIQPAPPRAEPMPGQFAYLDALDQPRISLEALKSGAADGIYLEADDAPRQFPSPTPEFHDDPDGARLFSGFHPGVVTYPPTFLASARDARIIGYRTVLRRDGYFFNDDPVGGPMRAAYLDRMRSPDDFLNEDTGLREAPDPALFVLDHAGRPEQRLDGSVVVLCSHEPSNFGSFLFRVLPKISALQRFGLDRLPLLAYAHAPSVREFLELAGLDPERLIVHDTHTIYSVEHAILPCLRNNQAFLDTESRALFARMRERCGNAADGRRIYISRAGFAHRSSSTRVMLNEAELIARLAERGFQIVEPETMPAREQIATFSAASLVVGPSGSGMFNVAFCHPATRVIDIESEPHWIHAHRCLFASCELRYGIFEGKVDDTDHRPVHRRWRVNVEALMQRIETLAA